MLKVIFGFGVIAFALQIALTSVPKCPKFQNQENLNMDKVLGRWNVIRANGGDYKDIPCLFVNLTKLEPDRFAYNLCFDNERSNFTVYCETHLHFKSSGELISMPVDNTKRPTPPPWAPELPPTIGFYVRETDYDNYAVMLMQDCPGKKLIIILSRHHVFNQEQIDRLTEKYITGEKVTWMNSFTNCGKNGTTNNNTK